jgi:aspartyl protease family protein
MKLQNIFWIFMGCVMIAALFRYSEQSSAPAVPSPANASASAPPSPSMPDESGAGVVLQRESNGHFFATANINGRDIRFLVDTGATAVALTSHDAEAMGLYWSPAELTKVGRGVNGDVMGKAVIVPIITIGDLEARNVKAAIIPDGLDVSLLGQTFLSQVKSVNISGDKMTLR